MKLISVLAFIVPLSAETVPTVRVETREILRESTQPVIAEAFHQAEFGSMVTGYVAEVKVDIGDKVKAGQPLAVIDVPELLTQLASRQAHARQVASEIAATEAKVDAAMAENKRVAKLVANGAVNSKVGDEARERLASAEALRTAAESRHLVAKARVAEIETLIDYTTLKAPFDGVVVRRAIDPGDLVHAGGAEKANQQLFHVAQIHPLRVVAHLPEREAILADPGDPVVLMFDALSGRHVTGTISRTAGSLDRETQQMRVEIDLANKGGHLPPGMFGRVKITLEKRENAVVIPAAALRHGLNGPMVYTVEDGRIRHQPVELGIDGGTFIEITKGLQSGDVIVTGKIERLAIGTEVQTR